jgi:hypothetical protein
MRIKEIIEIEIAQKIKNSSGEEREIEFILKSVIIFYCEINFKC